MSEQYVRERKSNATKQFAYNKLKNDRNPTSPKSKPLRPPQPKKVANVDAEKEAMLIDLSPSENSFSLNSSGQIAMSQSHTSNISILDEPIDVPTETTFELNELSSTVDVNTKLEPPPYQAPPVYMNTANITRNTNSINTLQEDPFDTSYIHGRSTSNAVDFSLLNNVPTSITQINKFDENLLTDTNPKNNQKSMTNQFDSLIMNSIVSLSPQGSTKNLSTLTKTDVKPSNISLSHWQTSGQLNVSQGSSNSSATPIAAASQNSSFLSSTNDDESLSDSMKINLSTLTLDDSLKNSFTNNTKRLDKAFYAELEKEMYKNDLSAVNVLAANSSQTIQNTDKDNTVSAIPSEIYRSDLTTINLNKVENFKPGSLKYTNTLTKSINQEVVQPPVTTTLSRSNNYELSANFSGQSSSSKIYSPIPYQQYHQKQNNIDSSSNAAATNVASFDTNAVISQIWFDQQQQLSSKYNSPQKSTPLYGTIGNLNSGSNQQYANSIVMPSSSSLLSCSANAPDKNHGFVAIANRPPISNLIQNDVRLTSNTSPNIYSTVAGDLYGSIGGDLYEPLINNSASVNLPSVRNINLSSNDSQSLVIYDEVAAEDLLRPHRPAPLVPPMLSDQQIKRRLEKERRAALSSYSCDMYGNLASANQDLYGNLSGGNLAGSSIQIGEPCIEAQKIDALINEIGPDDNPTKSEAIQALQAVNWNHSLAVRQFKIERLLR